MLRLVGSHQLLHLLIEFLPVLSLVHIDKVYNHNTSHIPQPELARNLCRSREVNIESSRLLVVCYLGTVTAIHIDNVHSLRVLDDEVGASFERYILGKQRLNLSRDVEVVEDGSLALIEFHNALLLGSNHSHIIYNLVVECLIVYADSAERAIERVADDGIGAAHLACQQCRCGLGLDSVQGLLPTLDEGADVLLDVGIVVTHSGCADNHTVVLGQHLIYDCLQSFALLVGANLLRNGYLVGKGDENHISSCQRDIGGQTRTFGRYRLLGHLYKYRLTCGDHLVNLATLSDGLVEFDGGETRVFLLGREVCHQSVERCKVGPQIEIVDKRILLVTNIHKGGIQAGHNLAYPAQIDVANSETSLIALLVEFDKLFVLHKSNSGLARRYVNNKFPVHLSGFVLLGKLFRRGYFHRVFAHFLTTNKAKEPGKTL